MMIKQITFEEIEPFWEILWPDFNIEKRSGRLLLFGFDHSIIVNDNIKVSYFGAEVDGKIVGVNSGFKPKPHEYRSRGLFVLPEYRKRGIAQRLFNATQAQGYVENAITLWSMPRRPALPAYLKFGFKVLSDFTKEEFGENCFVMKVIK